MSTRTKTSSRTQSTRIVLDPEELEAPGLEPGERSAGVAARDLPLPAAPSRELSQGLIDEALDRARLRGMLELPDGGQISDEVIDQLLAGARTEAEIAGPGGLLAQLTKRLIERALEVELTEHVGYEPHAEPPGGAGNARICRAQHMRAYVARRTMLRTALRAKAHLAACVLTAACGEGGVSDR